MSRLTKEGILAAKDLQREEVEVPEWGGSVLVQGLSGIQRHQYQRKVVKGFNQDGSPRLNFEDYNQAEFVAMVLVNEDGSPMFTGEEVKALGKKSAVALERVEKVGMKLSGLGGASKEEAEKN